MTSHGAVIVVESVSLHILADAVSLTGLNYF